MTTKDFNRNPTLLLTLNVKVHDVAPASRPLEETEPSQVWQF